MNDPQVKLGQSAFQDTFFVACAQETPYRRLRQLELEIRELKNALVLHSLTERRDDIKQKRLAAEVATADSLRKLEIEVDLEEISWKMANCVNVMRDAQERLANFEQMRAQLLDAVPQSYWDMGFEVAEQQYWEIRISKQLAYSRIIGLPDKSALDQLMLMPPESRATILRSVQQNILEFGKEEKLAIGYQEDSLK